MVEPSELLPRCCICNAFLGKGVPLTTFQCRHPVCRVCANECYYPDTGLFYCPIDQVVDRELVEMNELGAYIEKAHDMDGGQTESDIEQLRNWLTNSINYSNPCLDPLNCDQQLCPHPHKEPTIECPRGLTCSRRPSCFYAHTQPANNHSGENPLPIQDFYRITPPEIVASAFVSNFSFAGAKVGVEETEISIKSESLYNFLVAGETSELDRICYRYGVMVSIVKFRNEYCVDKYWAYGSLERLRYFSTTESNNLESNIPYQTSLQVAMGTVFMIPKILIVANAAYRPVFRIQVINSVTVAAKLIVHDSSYEKREAIRGEIERLEEMHYVANNVDGDELFTIVRENRLYCKFVNWHHVVFGRPDAIQSAINALQAAPTIDNVTHIAINGALTSQLIQQVAERLNALLFNQLLIGDRSQVFNAMFVPMTFDNSLLNLQFSEATLRTYHLSLNGNALRGCVEDIVLAANQPNVEMLNFLNQVHPALSVYEIAGKMIEAQQLPPRQDFEPWYFTQDTDCEVTRLQPVDAEYTTISQAMVQQGCVNPILMIEAVRNKPLYLRYLKKLKEVQAGLGDVPKVRRLFHGPRFSNPVDMLLKNDGFRQRAGTGSWGIGFYFAEKANKSLLYAYQPADIANRKVILLCDVIIGNHQRVLSDSKLRAPPMGMNSVFGKGRGSDMYIVYDADQALIRYIITLGDVNKQE